MLGVDEQAWLVLKLFLSPSCGKRALGGTAVCCQLWKGTLTSLRWTVPSTGAGAI